MLNKPAKFTIINQQQPRTLDNQQTQHISGNNETTRNNEDSSRDLAQQNEAKENDYLDKLFTKLDTLNEETTGKVQHMLALTKLAQHKYDEAILYLKLASEKGYSKASFNLGLCFQKGLGVERDKKMVSSLSKSKLLFICLI